LTLKQAYFKQKIQIALSFNFAVLHPTFPLYSMQFDQSEHFFMSGIQVSIHDRVNYVLKFE